MYRKYSVEEKIEIVEGYLKGEYSLDGKAKELGYNACPGSFKRWVSIYRAYGRDGLIERATSEGHKSYSKEFKEYVVLEYLDGKGSARELCAQHKISNENLLYKWVDEYNSCIELTDYHPVSEVYMAEARRKTTLEERIEIVKACIESGKDYSGTAHKYNVSYSQVYSWTKKYMADGEEGLSDRRGRKKSENDLDETEKLRRENARLKRQLKERDMTVELLKKVKELERM